MKHGKIGSLTLSGLIIGPLLGSGIILLPTIIYENLGNYAIFAWLVMSVIGICFAYVCGELMIQFPGEAGLGNAMESAFGTKMKNLASIFLMIAALMGPVAVMMTAAEYIQTWLFPEHIKVEWIAIILLVMNGFILLIRLNFLGKLSFFISTFAVLILVSGSIFSLLNQPSGTWDFPEFHFDSFGYSLLLLFWTIVGWEIVGNYSSEVKNPKSTIRKAIFFSAAIILLVNILLSAAVQWTTYNSLFTIRLTGVMYPLFGPLAIGLLAIVATGLCITTHLMVVGGVARLIASLSKSVPAFHFLTKKLSNGAPYKAIALLVLTHLFFVVLLLLNIVTVEQLVGLANAFFIANALIGLFSAIKLLAAPWIKGIAIVLSVLFGILLLRSSIIALLIILVVTLLLSRWGKERNNKVEKLDAN
ncbi:Inner membrane protein yjeH [Mycobacteroides abscessus subsp. abscessus]|nr:Inner membrane protein yjeH [Mycobacteroides abscessus subsp. abscessus]